MARIQSDTGKWFFIILTLLLISFLQERILSACVLGEDDITAETLRHLLLLSAGGSGTLPHSHGTWAFLAAQLDGQLAPGRRAVLQAFRTSFGSWDGILAALRWALLREQRGGLPRSNLGGPSVSHREAHTSSDEQLPSCGGGGGGGATTDSLETIDSFDEPLEVFWSPPPPPPQPSVPTPPPPPPQSQVIVSDDDEALLRTPLWRKRPKVK